MNHPLHFDELRNPGCQSASGFDCSPSSGRTLMPSRLHRFDVSAKRRRGGRELSAKVLQPNGRNYFDRVLSNLRPSARPSLSLARKAGIVVAAAGGQADGAV
jgi:hypothetical protein